MYVKIGTVCKFCPNQDGLHGAGFPNKVGFDYEHQGSKLIFMLNITMINRSTFAFYFS